MSFAPRADPEGEGGPGGPPPPHFGGPLNFIKRGNTSRVRPKTLRFSTLQLPGPSPPFRNPVSAPDLRYPTPFSSCTLHNVLSYTTG